MDSFKFISPEYGLANPADNGGMFTRTTKMKFSFTELCFN